MACKPCTKKQNLNLSKINQVRSQVENNSKLDNFTMNTFTGKLLITLIVLILAVTQIFNLVAIYFVMKGIWGSEKIEENKEGNEEHKNKNTTK